MKILLEIEDAHNFVIPDWQSDDFSEDPAHLTPIGFDGLGF